MTTREHGGGLDAAIARFGGTRSDWIDLSTGINPNPYPIGDLDTAAWGALPDTGLNDRLIARARTFWNVPPDAEVVVAGGASAIIAALPEILPEPLPSKTFALQLPTYNEYEASFTAKGWTQAPDAPVQVFVHPNNPDGRLFTRADIAAKFNIIDESFCDPTPDQSLIALSAAPGGMLIKSFGKFWGLAGLRLGFAICLPELAKPLKERLGPWPASAPSLEIGARALGDPAWAKQATAQMGRMADNLDQVLNDAGLEVLGGSALFRLARHNDAAALHQRLCAAHILTRPFSYAPDWLRFGLPKDDAALMRVSQALRAGS